MRGAFLFAWACLTAAGALLAPTSALAADAPTQAPGTRTHVGRSFTLRVPHGFRPVASAEEAQCPIASLDLVGRVAPPQAMQRSLFVSGEVANPEAMLLVARIEVNEGTFASSRRRHRYMLDRLHLSDNHFDSLVVDGTVELRATEAGGHEALEMKHAGAEGPLGLEEPAGAALLVDGGTHVLVVVLMVRDTDIHPLEETWASVRGSLDIAPPAAFARSALLYGGVGLVVLLLLVLLLRFVASRRKPPAPGWDVGGRVSLTSEGWGGLRPNTPAMQPVMPVEPASGMPPHLEQPVPQPRTAPAAEEPPPLPTAEPTPLRAADPHEAPGAAPERAQGPGTAPPPGARPDAPTRPGLKRTLPSSGRYSD